jgi:hypothetical protein
VAPISTNLIYSYIAEHVLGLPRSFWLLRFLSLIQFLDT